MVKRRTKSHNLRHAADSRRAVAMSLLWEGPSSSTRGPKADLTLDAVVDVGLAIVDAEGLAALTMARVAEELGVTPMATYRHVPGKEELLDLMIDAAFAGAPNCAAHNWRMEVARWARAELALLKKRPWLLQTILRRVTIGPNWTAWLNAMLAALSSTGLRSNEMFATATLVDAHVRATAQMFVGAPGEWSESFDAVLRHASTKPQFAALTRVVAESGREADAKVEDAIQGHFEFGLERLLDGIDVLVSARSARGRKQSRSIRSRK
jgi:AcrR family transcriptional regulator